MNTWTPSDVVTIIAALSALAVSVINALKSTQAKQQTEDNQQRINSMAQHLQNHDQQITTLALNIPAPAVESPGGRPVALPNAAPGPPQ